MFTIEARNANDGYAQAVEIIRRWGVPSGSRGGDVLVLPGPLMTTVYVPRERVLLDSRRDANPFLHMFDALHCLAGRDDYTFLDRFRRGFSASYGEPPDGRGHGAYGARWRSHFGFDQLDVVVRKLRDNPEDRRVVLQMWDSTNLEGAMTLQVGANDLRGSFNDHPCNTHIYPRILELDGSMILDLTVCCRSNDLIWGLFGANIVQFSMLLEYLASRIGVGVGRLHTLSNNAHAYVKVLNNVGTPEYGRYTADPYARGDVDPAPIVGTPDLFDEDLRSLMRCVDEVGPVVGFEEGSWLLGTAKAMLDAHTWYRDGNIEEALAVAEHIESSDWRMAAVQWLERRRKA